MNLKYGAEASEEAEALTDGGQSRRRMPVMRALSYADTFKLLLLQAADKGRGTVLFGGSLSRAMDEVPPFLIGREIPFVYLEHPLIGDPFLDITLVLGRLEPDAHIDSPAAGELGTMLDWYADLRHRYTDVCCGFELDTKEPTLPEAAIHFQPRSHADLVRPFCATIGEADKAELYLDFAKRMPEGWPLSYLGLFRGRTGSPLRACGYLDRDERIACSKDPDRLRSVFETIGFSAYDDAMLAQVSAHLAADTDWIDFQLDVYPDGHLGNSLALGVSFGVDSPAGVRKSFEDGTGASVMGRLEEWGVADDRWKLAVASTFGKSVPVRCDDGETRTLGLVLMPKWAKARWIDGVLQPAKLYLLAKAEYLDD